MLVLALAVSLSLQAPAADKNYGHSQHGVAFDEGPRQRPVAIVGIGRSHFKITTKVPEVTPYLAAISASLNVSRAAAHIFLQIRHSFKV